MMNASFSNERVSTYENFSSRDLLPDEEEGRKDGNRNKPPSGQSTWSEHEALRINQARTNATSYIRRIQEKIDAIDVKLRREINKRDEEYKAEKRLFNKQRDGEIARLNEISGPQSLKVQALEAIRNEAQNEYNEARYSAGRTPRLTFHRPMFESRWLSFCTPYIAMLLILSALEVPINVLAVELAFRFDPPISYVIAYLIGISFVGIAHFIGIQFLRLFEARRFAFLGHLFLVLLSTLLALIIILVLFEMRGQVANFSGGSISTQDLLGAIGGDGGSLASDAGSLLVNFFSDPFGAIRNLIDGVGGSDPVRFAQIGLLLLNALVLIIGVVLSVARHDRNPRLEATYLRLQASTDSLRNHQDKHVQEIVKISEIYENKIQLAERNADRVQEEIQQLNQQRDQIEHQAYIDVTQIISTLRQQLAAYQKGNSDARTAPRPAYFGHSHMARLKDEVFGQ